MHQMQYAARDCPIRRVCTTPTYLHGTYRLGDTSCMGLALFDLDNTLLDREAAFSRWAQGFIGNHGLSEDAWPFMHSADGNGMTPKRTFFQEVTTKFGMTNEVEDLVTDYFHEYPACFTVEEDTVEGLRQLRARGWRVGVITNGTSAQLAKLKATHLIGEFDAICVSEIVGVAKPDPAIFDTAAELCQTLEGWMTGDSVSADIAGGRGVGLHTIWIARGRTWTSPDPAPDAIVATVPEAIKIILETEP
jgi:putative hydrolase of the HAD superfamily